MALIDDREKYNSYMRKYHLLRYHRIRKSVIEKLGGRCVSCGSQEKLQLDHKNPKTKEIEVSRFLSVAKHVFEREVEKCQLLCPSCHAIKTNRESGKRLAKGTHGTLSSYRYCHCSDCREAKRIYTNKYRLTHPRKKSPLSSVG